MSRHVWLIKSFGEQSLWLAMEALEAYRSLVPLGSEGAALRLVGYYLEQMRQQGRGGMARESYRRAKVVAERFVESRIVNTRKTFGPPPCEGRYAFGKNRDNYYNAGYRCLMPYVPSGFTLFDLVDSLPPLCDALSETGPGGEERAKILRREIDRRRELAGS